MPATTAAGGATFATMLGQAGASAGAGCQCAPGSTGAADAAQAQRTLATGGGGAPGLQESLARLQQSVAELQRQVEAFVEQLNARGGVAPVGAGAMPPAGIGAAGAGGAPMQAPMKTLATAPMKAYGGGPVTAASRTNAIPDLQPGQTEQLKLARGQVTYREINVQGGAAGTTINPPNSNAPQVELYVLRDHQRGAHTTQVLEPITGPVTVGPGESLKVIARVKGTDPGRASVDVAGARLEVETSTRTIQSLPMMAWINESAGSKRGASGTNISDVLAHFGVSATGNSGVAGRNAAGAPVQYFSAAYEAANRVSPAETARRIVEAEQRAAAGSPGATFWVQVSDEQDTSSAQVAGTVDWIAQLKSELARYGSNAKLFVAAQAKPMNLAYARVVDGWATTQSAAGRSRDQSMADIQAAAQQAGRSIEIMQYPGNAFFDAGTTGGAAISTASAALDGASSWFIYSANNLDTLEQGGGDEGRGDIGGLVAIDGGRVLPTIALIEAEMGASLGATARSVGGTALAGSGATQIRGAGDALDAYKHGASIDLRSWEQQIAAML